MKFLYHVFILAVGLGLGIWIGVKYPAQAKSVADTESQQAAKIQAVVSQEKINLLNQFMSNDSSRGVDAKAEFNQMLQDEKQKLQDAKSKLGN